MLGSRMRGLTLVELMVSMVLGLVVVGGAISLTLANRQSFRTSEGVSQVQESARTAFELISRDIRQAGVTGCDNEGNILNVLDPSGGVEWWMDWFGILGHDADTSAVVFGTTTRGDRVPGTDALQLQGIDGIPLTIETHNTGAAEMVINAVATDLVAGDVMIACDFDHAAIFQASAYDATAVSIQHGAGVGTPGNCTNELGFPGGCITPSSHQFPPSSLLGRFFATDWYVGQTLRADEGGRALFRQRLGPGGVLLIEEIVAGVTDMQLTYRVAGGNTFETAGALAAGDWDDVTAVRVALTIDSADARVSSDFDANQGRLQRNFAQIITLRNRVP